MKKELTMVDLYFLVTICFDFGSEKKRHKRWKTFRNDEKTAHYPTLPARKCHLFE